MKIGWNIGIDFDFSSTCLSHEIDRFKRKTRVRFQSEPKEINMRVNHSKCWKSKGFAFHFQSVLYFACVNFYHLFEMLVCIPLENLDSFRTRFVQANKRQVYQVRSSVPILLQIIIIFTERETIERKRERKFNGMKWDWMTWMYIQVDCSNYFRCKNYRELFFANEEHKLLLRLKHWINIW